MPFLGSVVLLFRRPELAALAPDSAVLACACDLNLEVFTTDGASFEDSTGSPDSRISITSWEYPLLPHDQDFVAPTSSDEALTQLLVLFERHLTHEHVNSTACHAG